MLRLLLADDENFFRESLKASIDWEEHGIEICGEAENGQRALELVEQLRPDIVLADINMPRVNGLDFIREAHQIYQSAKFIIISGYDNFEYAKKAISYGVKAYLLKPVNQTELLGILDQLSKDISKEEEVKVTQQKTQEELEQNRKIATRYFLTKLLLQDEPDDEVLRQLQAELGGEQFFRVFAARTGKKEKDALRKAVKEKSRRLHLETGRRLDFFEDDQSNIVCLLSSTLPFSNEDILDLIEGWKQETGCDAAYGIGTTCHSCSEIRAAYQEALKALPFDISGTYGPTVSFGKDTSSSRQLLSISERVQLKKYLKQKDYQQIEELVRKLFAQLETDNFPTDIVKVFSIEILLPCADKIHREIMSFEERVGKEKIFKYIDQICTYEELKAYILGIYENECSEAQLRQERELPEKIRKINAYIDEHYGEEELSVGRIAQEFFLNYNYLCVLFKKHMGMTINDCILETRMQKAAKLISNEQLTVQEISNQVGFSNVNYFSKCFKKKFGIPPREYIQSIH